MARDHIDSDPIADLAANTALPFEQARAMPPSVYTSQAFLEAELAEIFRKEWYCVGRAGALSKPGDYVTGELAGQPFIVARGRTGSSGRCPTSACTGCRRCWGRGSTRAIVCPYHAWTYNLDGTLRGAPAMTLNGGFDKRDYCLPQIRCEEWLGWVFVTLNPEAAPVAERLAQVGDMVAGYDMLNYTETFFEEHVWDTNWKVLAENFMESYHLPVCHAGTIGGLSKLEEMVCPPGLPAFNYHTILKDDSLRIAMAHPSNTRLKGEERRTTFLLALYPSLLITLTPGYFWYLSLHPRGRGRCISALVAACPTITRTTPMPRPISPR
ncbi:aromatic ring-hydroxylating dioxygenase subunit alpha [Seohaeicola zhoushanensis]